MKNYSFLKSEKQKQEKVLKKIEADIKKLKRMVPADARLHVAKHRNTFQYFMRTSGYEKTGTYIKKDNMEMAAKLAQIEFYEKLEPVLKKSVFNIDYITVSKLEELCESVMEKIHPAKRSFIKMPYISDSEYLRQWVNQDYVRMSFREGTAELYTKNGLRVRSKSEVIISEILDDFGIPFLYEKPLQLGDEVVHPDFTLLDMTNRKEVYWEHFGMMDDIEYRNKALKKMGRYEENGYYQHCSTIWTFETQNNPINIMSLRNMVRCIKGRLGYE
ncbi:MAG: hypothetical protein K5848_08455 [Lachnospiraceae bacterium]|nr:hypothetical protein [Lachnospiraceae bacterium]